MNGGLFEKIIAKMIGGIAEGIFDLTTNDTFGVGFKQYDELIFGNTDLDIAPFTNEQWNKMMQWYRLMTIVAGTPILIAVIVLSYKLIMGSFSIEKRSEAKDNILRLFFGGVAITLAPLFVKLILYLNNNLVKILVLRANGGTLDGLLGNSLLSNIRTGNAILTALIIAMFAYLFVKLNIKFIIRHFTILIFTIFTPIVATMWIMNRRTIGASIWFGQILINVFMQFIYAFLFLVYLNFLPSTGGWAISLLWALMILPLAEVLQNTLQNLVSRIAGVQNEELSNRGIGMASEMAHTIRAFSYQFKNGQSNGDTSSGLLSSFMKKTSVIDGKSNQSYTSPIQTTPVQTSTIKTKPIEPKQNNPTEAKENSKIKNMNKDNISNGKDNLSPLKMATKVGGAFFNAGGSILNTGMYIAEGRNFKNGRYDNRKQNRNNINNTRKEDYKEKEEMDSISKIEMDNRYD